MAWAPRWDSRRAVTLVLAIGLPLALLDELYQRTFGSGRAFELRDLVVDGVGLTLGAAVTAWLPRRPHED